MNRLSAAAPLAVGIGHSIGMTVPLSMITIMNGVSRTPMTTLLPRITFQSTALSLPLSSSSSWSSCHSTIGIRLFSASSLPSVDDVKSKLSSAGDAIKSKIGDAARDASSAARNVRDNVKSKLDAPSSSSSTGDDSLKSKLGDAARGAVDKMKSKLDDLPSSGEMKSKIDRISSAKKLESEMENVVESAKDKLESTMESHHTTAPHYTKSMTEKAEDLGKKACTKASDASHKVCDASCSGTEALKSKGHELGHGVKSDVAMEKAKDPNRPLTERAAEGLSGVKEKVQEVFSGGAKEAHKEAAKSHIKE